MKAIITASLIGLAALSTVPAQAANVGVSINIGEPGFFGQIDLGNAPPPQLVYAQPMIIDRVGVQIAPIYLHVPLGFERDWRHHCREYNACGRPVYFVRDDWYRNTYVQHYHDHYYDGRWNDARYVEHREGKHDHDDHHDNRRDEHGKGDRHDDHRDDRRDDDRR